MLIPSYDPLVGGAEIQLSGLLRRIDRDRFDPFVLTRRLDGTGTADVDGYTPVVRLPAPLRPGSFFLSSLRYLWKRRRDYDVIHVHSFDSPALAGAVIKHLLPAKTYIQKIPRFGSGSSFDRLTRSRLGRARLRYVLKRADAIIPLCPDATSALEAMALPAQRIVSIPNGVDTDYFFPAGPEEKRILKRSFGICEEAFVGIVVARLIPRKNVMSVLEAWKRVAEQHVESVLIVVGNGPEGPRLKGYADDAFDGRAVIFTGKSSRAEVARLMRTADVSVSYSASEGMSNAMLEAMASGLPVVAARGPGIDQLVAHAKSGFLFDTERPAEGADYIMRLAEDPDLVRRMSSTARGTAEEEYSFERVARDFEQLYSGGRLAHRVTAQPVEIAAGSPGDSGSPVEQTPDQARKRRRSKKRRGKKRAKAGCR
jgi:glycosyltransferase involved in cell wall biosynthesis